MVLGAGRAEVRGQPVGPVRRLEAHQRIVGGVRGHAAGGIAVDDDDAAGLEPARGDRPAELAQVEGAGLAAADDEEAGNPDHLAGASLASASFRTRAWMLSNSARPGGHSRATHSALRKASALTSRR